MNCPGLSLIIFLHKDIEPLISQVKQIDQLFSSTPLKYEVIVIKKGSHSDETLETLSKNYHVKSQSLNNNSNQALISALGEAQFDIIATLPDASLPLKTIIEMSKQVYEGHSDLLTEEKSGLRVFRKEISDRIYPVVKSVSFDLEFLKHAKEAGYKVGVFASDETTSKYKNHHSAWHTLKSRLKLKLLRSAVIPFHPETEKVKGRGFHYKGQEYIHHSSLTPSQTALHRLSGVQTVIFISLGLITLLMLFLNWHTTIIVIVALLTTLYFADLLFNLYLIYRSFSKPAEVEITKEEIDAISQWPTYTILCPLYKEWRVIPQFVTAISHLDYPKDKLQVMLLLEEDDKETIREVQNITLPSYFQTVIVPDSKPKTKPKASNFGLLHATGEHIVIYDAEDVPDKLQLKKAVLAFDKTNSRTICIQAKLNFYNPHQNLLTRVFTAEYSLWFDLVLTGLQSIHAPIPLGGTSNHFKTADLKKLKGWDSFNVTEDCDLGMRLVKQGYQTAVINSVTLEEANSSMSNWFWQRTRWIKGYMQTYLIHMRRPQEFLKTWREPHAVTFQLVVGGKVLSMFINPLMWIITLSYFMFRANIGTFIESFFPAPVLYMGVISLLLGNFLYVYYYMIGCAKHGHHELVKYGVFIPLYWLAMSMAAWVAVYKLIVAPHYWAKTKHGLHLDNAKAVLHTNKAISENHDKTVNRIPISTPATAGF